MSRGSSRPPDSPPNTDPLTGEATRAAEAPPTAEAGSTASRLAARAALLARSGWGDALVAPLAGDASFRRYARLTRADGHTAVLMDAPPEHEDVRPFVTLARHLVGLGFSAPLVLAADETAGYLLLEDLGDDTFFRLIRIGVDETDLYTLAVDTLSALHQSPPHRVIPAGLPAYDADLLLREAGLFADWLLPALGLGLEPADRRAFDALWRKLVPIALAVPQTLVLRDFHGDNLMRLRGRPGIAACGLLDFQDAVAGPVTYDLMSLLEDARRDIAPDLVARLRARYLASHPNLDQAAFEASWAVLAAQRHLKVLGIFTRLDLRDGKPIYLKHIPRLWRLLDQALAHPALEPLAAWLAVHCPRQHRIIPPRTLDDGSMIGQRSRQPAAGPSPPRLPSPQSSSRSPSRSPSLSSDANPERS